MTKKAILITGIVAASAIPITQRAWPRVQQMLPDFSSYRAWVSTHVGAVRHGVKTGLTAWQMYDKLAR